MRLFIYAARGCFAAIGLCLFALVIAVVTMTLVENAAELTRDDLTYSTTFFLALYSSVEYAYTMLPVACLIGVLIAGTQMVQRGEILAMQAAGLGMSFICAPFVVVAFVVALLGTCAGELLVPWGIAGRHRIQRDEIHHVDKLTQFYYRRSQWFREQDWLLHFSSVDTVNQVFQKPTVYHLKNGLLQDIITADRLFYEDQHWFLESTQQYHIQDATIDAAAKLLLPIEVSPDDLINVTGNPREMSLRQMLSLLKRRQRAGFDITAHHVEWYNRLTYPWAALWLVLAAVPWAVHPNRARSLSTTLGAGVVVVALELCATQIFRLLALAHKIPPIWGSCGASCVCIILIPISLFLYQRRYLIE